MKKMAIILPVLFFVVVGKFFNLPKVSAAEKARYKVVKVQHTTSEGYEKLLNELTNEGWKFDHTISNATEGTLAVFKKP